MGKCVKIFSETSKPIETKHCIDGPLQKLCFLCHSKIQDSRHKQSFNKGPYGKNNEKFSRLKVLGQFKPNFAGMVLA